MASEITFPLKAHYNAVTSDLFNPMLIEAVPEADEESDMETPKARAPPDLDARVRRDGLETPPIIPHPSDLAEEMRVEDREDGLSREDDLEHDRVPGPPTPVAREREDRLPREATPPLPSEPDDVNEPVKVTDEKSTVAFKG